jgi:hypothetical protein
MSKVDREACRDAAAECVHLARIATDPQTKEALLIRAQEWLKLAYSENDTKFERLLGVFNNRQMAPAGGRKVGEPGRMQQQPIQQQQSRIEPEE